MTKAMLRILGVAALVGQSGCLPTYEPPGPKAAQGPQGPGRSDQQTSGEPVAVRPLDPQTEAAAWMQYGDPALIAARAADEGPLEVASRRHSCMKMKFSAVGQILEDLGINMRNTNTDPAPAGAPALLPVGVDTVCDGLVPGVSVTVLDQTTVFTGRDPDTGDTFAAQNFTNSTDQFALVSAVAQPARYIYCDSRLTLGLPLYSARLGESTGLTTASITKQFDVFSAAAVEIVRDNLSRAARCKDALGKLPVLFNADSTCNEQGIACMQGYPATQTQVNLCNKLVQGAAKTPGSTVQVQKSHKIKSLVGNQNQLFTIKDSLVSVTVPEVDAITTGKRLAVAALLSSAHLCE